MPPSSPQSMTRAPRRSRPVRVADEIKQWVVEQDLQRGDRLPAEPEMIERFGMAKGTIREAMRILEAQGLIETRTGPGGGSFVGEVSAERARALLGNYFYFKNLTIADIYQVRRVLEPELAASLAGKLTDAQLAELEELADQFPDPPRSAAGERAHHVGSLEVHARLASFADNELLGFLIGFMSQILSDLTIYRRLYNPPNIELWRKGRECHQRLLVALRDGAAEEAREIMLEHMEAAEAMMITQEAEVQRRFMAEQRLGRL
ncbi:FadR/GntR family transcriptional regulator [Roseobacter sinensis]|uniref:FCD domain-containing protein n=1 Tax=Roseobacter sinensis TaxID=2931391 RepID=A0ABT3BE18_9RHOB|nr:FCD domain-containing protein [Roseobacter sp. WL0113]MCV3271821.1 FCD domain-containing protein [Roseobacter sp. WL0113]